MLDRILDMVEQLLVPAAEDGSPAPLVSDECGDDYEHAATALQALTVIATTRGLRSQMQRWEWTTNERGQRVRRLRPEVPPSAEEAAENAARMAEIVTLRKPPAADIWDPESTVRSAGKAMGREDYKAYLKAKGRVEISGYDFRNGTTVRPQREIDAEMDAEIERRAADVIRHAIETGQLRAGADGLEDPNPNAPVVPLPAPPSAPMPTRPKAPLVSAAERGVVAPQTERVPYEQRKPVDITELQTTLYSNAATRAIAAANARDRNGIGTIGLAS